MSVAIMAEEFDGTLRPALTLVVEIAWGADVTAADTTWTWTDVTADVYLDPGVSITLGRGDEASTPQPAECTFVLDNTSGDYSQTPRGANWPNVKRGTPIRVRAVLGVTSHTRFEGFAVGFTPGFVLGADGTIATTAVTAAGVLRRLGQGETLLESVLRTSIPTLADLSAYWPLEDDKTATSFASGLSGGLPMSITGTPGFASNSDFAASLPIPALKDAYLLGYVNPRVTSSVVKVTFLASFPDSGSASPNASTICRVHTTGSIVRWDLVYDTGGALELRGFDFAGEQFTSGPVGFAVDGKDLRIGIALTQIGSDIDVKFNTLEVGASGALFGLGTATGQTITGCYAVAFAPDRDQTNVAVGHCYVQTTSATSALDLVSQLNAFTGEGAGTRFGRLCDQVGVPHTTSGTTSTTMGPQAVDTFLHVVQECAEANLGVIYDGLSAGLTFMGRDVMENQAASMTVDATADAIIPPFDPVDDDQLLTNRWTVTQKDGSSAVAEDTDGPLGSGVVGLYDSSLQVNVDTSDFLADTASWKVHETTAEGYRYPSFTLAFEAAPDLLAVWLVSSLLSRIDVTNAAGVMGQLPDQDIRMLVQGYTETIGLFSWVAAMNTTPYDPWRIAVLAADTGDTGEFLCRLDTDGSTIAAAAVAGATSLSVATPSGPLWTTAADDFPLDVEIAGIRVTVTDITGASSPQTFTVTGSTVTKDLAIGDAVSVWEPTVLGL